MRKDTHSSVDSAWDSSAAEARHNNAPTLQPEGSDEARAERLLTLAEAEGRPEAMLEIWCDDRLGIPRDRRVAALRRAVESGYAPALEVYDALAKKPFPILPSTEATLRRAVEKEATQANCWRFGAYLLITKQSPAEALPWLLRAYAQGSHYDYEMAFLIGLAAEAVSDDAIAQRHFEAVIHHAQHYTCAAPNMPLIEGRRLDFQMALGWEGPQEALEMRQFFGDIPKAHLVWLAEQGRIPQTCTEADLNCYAKEVLEHLRGHLSRHAKAGGDWEALTQAAKGGSPEALTALFRALHCFLLPQGPFRAACCGGFPVILPKWAYPHPAPQEDVEAWHEVMAWIGLDGDTVAERWDAELAALPLERRHLRFLERAAAADHGPALYDLWLLPGTSFTPRQRADAIRRALEIGYPHALYTYAVRSSLNSPAVREKLPPIDFAMRRVEALRRAAEAGHLPAARVLGSLLHERGDLDEAEHWLRRAYGNGPYSLYPVPGQPRDLWKEPTSGGGDLALHYRLGALAERRGNHAQAFIHLAKIAKLPHRRSPMQDPACFGGQPIPLTPDPRAEAVITHLRTLHR